MNRPNTMLHLPRIHVGGTHPDSLFDAARAALDALQEARGKVEATAPNGRDYPERAKMRCAEIEHQRRVDVLRGVEEELQAIAEHALNAEFPR